MHALVRAVNLVDHDDDAVSQLQRAGEDEAGLRHGTLRGVHQQDDAVDHLEHPLHLAAEVGVARGVDDVDLGVAIGDGGVLGENGDAPLALKVAGVHDPLHDLLVLPVDAALLQHRVHQRSLTVVDVGDNGHISQVVLTHVDNSSFSTLRTAGSSRPGRKQARERDLPRPRQYAAERSTGPAAAISNILL